MINFDALFKISYGLYILSSGDKDKGNGFISNTIMQVTAEPPKFAACCNKNNYTAELISEYRVFSASILDKDTPSDIFGNFGYKSGRDTDKMSGYNVIYGETGVPIVLNSAIAYIECKVVEIIDVGTHLIFIGELVKSELLDSQKEPITYLHYREIRKAAAPKNAPTYVDKSKLDSDSKKTDDNVKNLPPQKNETADKISQQLTETLSEKTVFKCSVCGFEYDESVENSKFSDLPNDWYCPVCGVDKSFFS